MRKGYSVVTAYGKTKEKGKNTNDFKTGKSFHVTELVAKEIEI